MAKKGIKCSIITKPVKELASRLGVSEERANNLVSVYQSLKDDMEIIPTEEEAKVLMESSIETLLDIEVDSPRALYNKEFSIIEKQRRIDSLARKFIDELDLLISKKKLELQEKVNKGGEFRTHMSLASELEGLKDSHLARKNYIDKYGIEAIREILKKDYLETYNLSEDEIKNAYGKILKHFDLIFEDASLAIEELSGLRILKDTAILTEEEVSSENDNTEENEESRQYESQGITYKIRMVDPYSTMSRRIKYILANIPEIDKDGNFVYDDLGELVYIKPKKAYNILMGELVSMLSPDDFITINDEGDTVFPALENIVPKYPWVTSIIMELENDPQLQSLFYSNFRQEYINYWGFIEGKTIPLNLDNRTQGAFEDLLGRYTRGETISDISIYNSLGNIVPENVEKVRKVIDQAFKDLSGSEIKDISNIVEAIRAIGVDTTESFIWHRLEEPGLNSGINGIRSILTQIKDNILDNVGNIPKDKHIVAFLKNYYTTIIEHVGVHKGNNISTSFRIGDKTYQSNSAPNYIDSLIKHLKDPKLRQQYLDEQYKRYWWFYDEKRVAKGLSGWRNDWLRLLEEDTAFQLALDTRELNNIDRVPYKDWDKSMIYPAFIQFYFQEKDFGWYHMPIFSDSPVVKFIKGPKYSEGYKGILTGKFIELVKQELKRIKVVQDRIKKEGIHSISNYDVRGLQFCFFPELNDTTILNDIAQLKKEGRLSYLYSVIWSHLKRILDSRYEDFRRDLNGKTLDGIKEVLIANKIIAPGEGVEELVEDKLEEYFWNSEFATSQIIQLTTTDLAYYKDSDDFQKRYKQLYSAGVKLNTNSTYGRDIERTVYIADEVITSITYNHIKKALQKSSLSKVDIELILTKFRDITSTDGQAYRSLASYRAILDMMGKWEYETMDPIYERLTKGEFTYSDFSVIWQTIKPFMYTQVNKSDEVGGEIKVPHQNKNSEFLLLAIFRLIDNELSQDSVIRGINRFMDKYDIDVVQFASAVKVGLQGKIDISAVKSRLGKYKNFQEYKEAKDKLLVSGKITQEEYNEAIAYVRPNEDEVFAMLSDAVENDPIKDPSGRIIGHHVIHELPYTDYMVQQPTPEHLFDAYGILGSQIKNLITSDISPNARFQVFGKEFNREELINLYRSLVTEQMLQEFEELRDLFKPENIDKLRDIIVEQVRMNPKYGRDTLNALDLITIIDPITKKEKRVFKVPLINKTTSHNIQEILCSLFKNRVTKQKIKGGNAILVSDYGLRDSLQIKFADDGSIKYIECLMPLYTKKYFEDFIIAEKDGSYSIDLEKLESLGLDKLIGYRIPTEDKYSMLPLKIVGFLPQQNGSAIMLPADITQISGSDFDIDKLFLMIYEFKKLKDGSLEKVKYNTEALPQKQSKEARNNGIIDIMWSILTNVDTAPKMVNPGSFDTVKKMARIKQILSDGELYSKFKSVFNLSDEDVKKKLLKLTTKELVSFVKKHAKVVDPMNPSTFVKYHYQNMTGGTLIGVYATNNVVHSKFEDLGITIKPEYTFTINGREMNTIDRSTFDVGNITYRTSKLIAEFLAASVDNAKDPNLGYLLQTKKTAKLLNAMLRSGMTIEEACMILTMPIVEEIFNSYGDLSSESIGKIRKEREKLIKDLGINIPTKIKSIKTFSFNTSDLIQHAIDAINMEDSKMEEYLNYDLKILKLLDIINVIANDLYAFTHISRSDSTSAAAAPSIGEVLDQIRKVEKVHISGGTALKGYDKLAKNGKIKFSSSIDDIREVLLESSMPILQAAYSLGIESIPSLLNEHFIHDSRFAITVRNNIAQHMKNGEFGGRMFDVMIDDIITFFLSKTELFGTNYAQKRNYFINEFPYAYKEILASIPELNSSTVLNSIREENGTLVLKGSTKLDRIEKDYYMSELESMLFSDNPSTINLALSLFMYSFYKDGLSFGVNNFGYLFSTNFLLTMPEYLETLQTISSKVENAPLEDYRSGSKFEEQFIKNHYSRLNLPTMQKGDNTIDGNVMFPYEAVSNSDGNPYKYLVIDGELYEMVMSESMITIEYSKATTSKSYGGSVYRDSRDIYEGLIEKPKKEESTKSTDEVIPEDYLPELSEAYYAEEDRWEYKVVNNDEEQSRYSEEESESQLETPFCN